MSLPRAACVHPPLSRLGASIRGEIPQPNRRQLTHSHHHHQTSRLDYCTSRSAGLPTTRPHARSGAPPKDRGPSGANSGAADHGRRQTNTHNQPQPRTALNNQSSLRKSCVKFTHPHPFPTSRFSHPHTYTSTLGGDICSVNLTFVDGLTATTS